jgi:hypothetical protein
MHDLHRPVGETDLRALLAGMEPILVEGVLVFATIAGPLPPGLDPVMMFREAEGATLIVAEAEARRHRLSSVYPCRMITLTIQSSLEAVGFLAAITTALAAEGISVNPVSAFHHDHLFVPAERVEAAMAALRRLASGSPQVLAG